MSTGSVIRLADVVSNKDAYKTAISQYYLSYVVDEFGSFVPCLLTADAINKGIDRATKNPEDIRGLNLFQKIYHKILFKLGR